jgi:hypothetical protein
VRAVVAVLRSGVEKTMATQASRAVEVGCEWPRRCAGARRLLWSGLRGWRWLDRGDAERWSCGGGGNRGKEKKNTTTTVLGI